MIKNATCLILATGSACAAIGYAQSEPPSGTAVHLLSMGRSAETVMTEVEVDNVLQETGAVLRVDDDGPATGDISCDVRYERNGSLDTLHHVPGTVLTAGELDQAFAAGRHLTVVDALERCGEITERVLGCARPTTGAVVLARIPEQPETTLAALTMLRAVSWAHEIGHASGIEEHRDEPRALMADSIGPSNMHVNARECAEFRLGPLRDRKPEDGMARRNRIGTVASVGFATAMLASTTVDGQAPVALKEFLALPHHHGLPANAAEIYSDPASVRTLERIVASDTETDWIRTTAAELLGRVGTPESFGPLRDAALHPHGASETELDSAPLRAAMRGIGRLTARHGHKVPGVDFLAATAEACRVPQDVECEELATAAVVALELTQAPRAQAAVCRLAGADWVPTRVRAAAKSVAQTAFENGRCAAEPAQRAGTLRK